MLELVDIGNKNNNLISPLECVMLLGVTGRNAAGKTTIVEWFVNLGWEGCSCSDANSHWLRENGQEITRENLTQGGRTLRSEGGPGVLAEMLLNRMNPKQNTIIDSIRTPDEVHVLITLHGLPLIPALHHKSCLLLPLPTLRGTHGRTVNNLSRVHSTFP